MNNEQRKLSIINTTNYLNKRYRNSSLRKLKMKSYYDKYFPIRKSSEDSIIVNTSESNLYYKDPKFYNEKSLDLQLNLLRNITKDNINDYKNNRKYTYTEISKASADNKILPILSRNNTVDLTTKFNKTDNKNSIKEYKNLILRRNTNYFNRSNTEGNIKKEINKNNHELPTDKLYKIIFKSQLTTNKDHLKPLIENKYNIKYSENEEQYNLIIDKENLENIAKGKKTKNKKTNNSIKLKLNEAQNKVKFMKDIIDYSYPLFVLTKIKVKQKNLRAMKNQRLKKYINYVSEKEKRLKEIKNRNEIRTQYLLKSFSFFK